MRGQCRRGADVQSLWPTLLGQKLENALEILQRVVEAVEKGTTCYNYIPRGSLVVDAVTHWVTRGWPAFPNLLPKADLAT